MDSANASELSNLAARVQKMERENRVLKLGGLIFLLAVGAVIAMGQAPTKRTVLADEFVLKDSTGNKRATLGLARGEPTLTLFDATGRERAWLGTEGIVFYDSSGTHRVILGSSTAVSYESVEGKAQITGQGPGLLLSSADKNTTVYLRGTSDGGSLLLYGRNPALTLTDAQGFKTIVGSATLATPSTGASSRTSAASIALFDKEDKLIWSVPEN
jgi:hypothetical protein